VSGFLIQFFVDFCTFEVKISIYNSTRKEGREYGQLAGEVSETALAYSPLGPD
jgi:hypothetical protein